MASAEGNGNGACGYRPGDKVEVFFRMPYGQDNGHERVDYVGERWMHCPTPNMGANRPRIGWTERWLPATVLRAAEQPLDSPPQPSGISRRVSFCWDVRLWFDWASGECIEPSDPQGFNDTSVPNRVRPRGPHWRLPPRVPGVGTPKGGNELLVGGPSVSVSFIVFRWGAARIPIQYDSHSWGGQEGSTVSAKFVKLFFDRAVVPRLGYDYEVLTVFIQHSDEFATLSPELLLSMCHGQQIVSLYFLWPIQGQQTYGDKVPATAAYVDQGPFYDLVQRMESAGVSTSWPHHSQLWRNLSCKDWVVSLSVAPQYHIPLTVRVPKSLIIRDARKAAKQALSALWHLQTERRASDGYKGPVGSDWPTGGVGCERCVAKLGFSYEGVDVKMVQGEAHLADALFYLVTQPCYSNDAVQVQQRVQRVDLEARCFVVRGQLVDVLYTRFARIDRGGYVRDYEKAHSEDEAMREWFDNDQAAWRHAQEQIQALTRRWNSWLLAQATEPVVSVRIDYMLERVSPGRADVWTGEIGEQGYSMGGVDPLIVFNAVLDNICEELVPISQSGTSLSSGTKRALQRTEG